MPVYEQEQIISSVQKADNIENSIKGSIQESEESSRSSQDYSLEVDLGVVNIQPQTVAKETTA